MNNLSKHYYRIMILAALILAAGALWLLVRPFEANDRYNEYLIGGTLLLTSVTYFSAFGVNRRLYFRPGWLLQEAFFLLLFSIVIFFLPYLDFEINAAVYGFMAFFAAAVQFTSSIQLGALEIRRWWIILIFALTNLLIGVYFIKICPVLNVDEYPSVAVYLLVMAAISLAEPFVYLKTPVHSRERQRGSR